MRLEQRARKSSGDRGLLVLERMRTTVACGKPRQPGLLVCWFAGVVEVRGGAGRKRESLRWVRGCLFWQPISGPVVRQQPCLASCLAAPPPQLEGRTRQTYSTVCRQLGQKPS